MQLDGSAQAELPRARELSFATGAFALLTVALTYPLSTRPSTVILGDYPDSHFIIWALGWIAHALANDPLSIFHANIFHPLQNTLAFSENFIGSGLIASPIIWTTGNHLLAHNIVALLSVVLCGTGAYLLARRIGLSAGGAFICGLIFAFSPARFFRLGQMHLTTVQWIPFALAYLHTYFARRRARDLRIAIAFFTLQAITTGHGAVFLTFAAVIVAGVYFVTGPRPTPWRLLRDVGAPGALLLVPAILIAVPYQVAQREMGLRRTLENWTVAGVSYIASPTRIHQAILGRFTSVEHVNATAHAYLFPGYLPILLAVLALAALTLGSVPLQLRRAAVCYGIIGALSILLFVGPPLGLWPLVYWLPGFNFIRVPSRFVILTVLALAVLAGIAVDTMRLARGARLTALVALTLALLAEFVIAPLPVSPFTTRPPAPERWLADQPKPFAVAEFPHGGAPREQTRYMLHSMGHWQKTVHGYSGIEPPAHTALYDAMKNFPDPATVQQLRDFQVTYAVVHIDRYSPDQWRAVDERLAVNSDLELLFQDSRSRVYRVRYDPRTNQTSRSQ